MDSPRQRGEELFLQRLAATEEVLQQVTTRRCASRDEAEEVRSLVMLKLIDNDYAVLRKFRGAASWRTFLTVVIQRQLLDLRCKEWGRWRPSAVARRLGPVAIELEKRIERDGLEPSMVIRQLSAEGASDEADLEALVARLPRRRRGQPMETEAEDVEARYRSEGPDVLLKRRRGLAELRASIGAALADLSQRDRNLLQLRFGRGWTVRRLAEDGYGMERCLYRRFQSILRRLRRRLEGSGLVWNDISQELDGHGAELDLDLREGLGG